MSLFTNPAIVRIIFESLRFLQRERNLQIYAYVVMENHLHMVVSSDDPAKDLANFRAYTARSIIDSLREIKSKYWLKRLEEAKLDCKRDRKHQFWQEGYHPKQIISSDMMEQKINYIHYNPVKRGYVDEPTDWRYSSARNYEDKKGIIPVKTDWDW